MPIEDLHAEVDGKPILRGRNTLSADRTRFTEVNWLVAKPSDVVTQIFERQ